MKKLSLSVIILPLFLVALSGCEPHVLTSGLSKDEIKSHLETNMTTDKINDTSTYTMKGSFQYLDDTGEHDIKVAAPVISPDYRENLNLNYRDTNSKYDPERVGFNYYSAPSMFLRAPVFIGKEIFDFKSPIYEESSGITDGWYRQLNEKMVSQTADSIAKFHTEINEYGGFTFSTTRSNHKILVWYVGINPSIEFFAISRWDIKFVYDANGLLISEYCTTTSKEKGERQIHFKSTYSYSNIG